ncbi:MAG TPA: ribosome biogenesis GTP-binding protein YihA/YsxC [Candidatus Angelobacter sp.]|nr:ribosome biogenesis GTP-binding protein YihA/YsxC [Candidatus Angelobacter sp.]
MKLPIARFVTSAAHPDGFPREGPPEFAFLGRSNVGKSSLINSLLGQRIAHVSSTPGRTRTINFIGIYTGATQPEPKFMLVDLPGYGYAKISRSISAEWPKFIEPYLEQRAVLQSSIVLVDVNVPPQPPDRQLIDFLQHSGRDFMLVGTKSDKLSGNKLKAALSALEKAHGVDSILPYSSRTGVGRTALWHAICERAETAQQLSRHS